MRRHSLAEFVAQPPSACPELLYRTLAVVEEEEAPGIRRVLAEHPLYLFSLCWNPGRSSQVPETALVSLGEALEFWTPAPGSLMELGWPVSLKYKALSAVTEEDRAPSAQD